MKKTLQDQYLLIKEGKGHKGVFLTEAKRQFPNIIRNAATFDEAVASLQTKNIISENVISVMPAIMDRPKKESYETAFEDFLAEARKAKENEDEKVKAEEKKVSKPVEKDLEKNFDNSDEKNPDNMIFDQIMMGYYAEMKDPKNADKTMQELKGIVFKNLSKDPIHYTKDGQFGIKDLGYVTEAPGLGTPKEAKGKYKSSGYGDLKESIQPVNEEEAKLRKVIREMVDAELEEAGRGFATMGTINLKGDGDGKIFIPKYYILPLTAIQSLDFSNPGENAPTYGQEYLIKNIRPFNLGGKREIAISKWFYDAINKKEDIKNPVKTKIKDLVDTNKEFKDFYGYVKNFIDDKPFLTIIDGKKIPYHKINVQVEPLKPWAEKELEKANVKLQKAKSGVVGRGRPINIKYLENFWIPTLEEYLSRPEGNLVVISQIEEGVLGVKLSLRESVEKDLMDINKEAEQETLQCKLDKIDVLIDKRKAQLGKLDEDEDMKALTDKKKVKELERDIKKLEVARNKVEKMMSKFKGKKKEVIDEDEPIDENLDVNAEYVEDAESRLDAGQDVDSIVDTYSNMGIDQKSDLDDYLNDIAPDDQKSDYVY